MAQYLGGIAGYTTESGNNTTKNVTVATVIKSSPGRVAKVFINTAPTGAGGLYDQTSTTVAAANLIQAFGTGTAIGPMDFDCRCTTGIMLNPGGGVMTISWS